MNIFSHFKLRTKLTLLLGLSTVALVVSIGAATSVMHTRMIDDRLSKLSAVVQAARGLAIALETKVTAHEITREQALAQMRDNVHAMRFDGGTGYIAATEAGGLTSMHGVNPKLEGKPTPIDARTGKTFATLADDALLNADEGVVTYMFPKPGQTEPQLKVSALAKFAPWQIVFFAGAYIDDLDADFRATLFHLTTIAGLALLVTLVVAWLINRDITASLGGLKTAMDRLAKGDLTTRIPGTDRRDEVGGMAASVLVFKQHMEQAERLSAAREIDRRRSEDEKQAALVAMAEKIEAETTTALHQVAQRTSAMTETAEEMSASAARTGGAAQSAANASAQALATAQTVAGAAEQLSASIHEIGGQVAKSTEIVGRAVAAGTDARATIEALNGQVTKIGAVADMIGAIAAKTNLLALNATIEAARAGDAGKGFAVVASEVKALATQTARSTEEIGQHISQVRNATSVSVAAVARIEQTIGEMDAIASSIAAAVEQQGAATAEIARNVSETASAANEMSSRTTEVSAEAEQTGKHAAVVRDNATGLNSAVEDLRHSVIRVVRTSTTEVDRRKTERYQVDLACHLNVPGRAASAVRVTDISEGGANVTGGPLLPQGTRGTLSLDGAGLVLPSTVQASEDGALRLKFELDQTTKARFLPFLERLAPRRAA